MAEQFLDSELVSTGSSGLHLSVATDVFFNQVMAYFITVGAVTIAWVLTPEHAIGHPSVAGEPSEGGMKKKLTCSSSQVPSGYAWAVSWLHTACSFPMTWLW